MERTLWAIPKESNDRLDEKVITSTSDSQHMKLAKQWAIKNGFHSFRITNIDGSKPDFVKAING